MNENRADALPMLRRTSGAVARRGEQLIGFSRFLSEVEDLAERLPDRLHVVNFCADRYRFTVAWTAAMLRGQVTLLPSRRDAGAVSELLGDYPGLYVVTDDEEPGGLADASFCYPGLDAARTVGRVPAFAPDQIAAVLFTSGSTGHPAASLRRWGRLVAGSLAVGRELGIERHAGAAVVSTVPHAHSYGLESAVMLPLQHGLLLTAERPFFPADVVSALVPGSMPSILVTTPVHLRALAGQAVASDANMRCKTGFVLSATAPLAEDLARMAEAIFAAPVFEIYGCSEAGQLATRRTTQATAWRCLDGFRLRNGAAGCWVSGPAEADVLLADEIELIDSETFQLRGRTADLVNVAGKRSSLAHLTSKLLAVDGVRDGVFLMPEADAANATPRLAAIAVAPGLDAGIVLGRLRQQIDAAFLPRPLLLVDALPRDALGKLPLADVRRLIGTAPTPPTGPVATALRLRIAADHPAQLGHFPGNPIVPGALLLDEILARLLPAGWAPGIEAAKFHHPVRFGEPMTLTSKPEGAFTRFECRVEETQQLALSGVIVRSSSPLQ